MAVKKTTKKILWWKQLMQEYDLCSIPKWARECSSVSDAWAKAKADKGKTGKAKVNAVFDFICSVTDEANSEIETIDCADNVSPTLKALVLFNIWPTFESFKKHMRDPNPPEEERVY